MELTKLAVIVGIFSLFPMGTFAAAFKCDMKGLNVTERTICNNPSLSGIDDIANKKYISKINDSLSVGTLKRQQLVWLEQRNKCGQNTSCIENSYNNRYRELTYMPSFSSVSEVFNELDKPLKNGLVNKYGFTISDKQWRIRPLVKEYDLNREFGIPSLAEDVFYWKILTHFIVKNDLVLLYIVKTDDSVFLMKNTDGKNTILAKYSRGDSDVDIYLKERSDSLTTYAVSSDDSEDIYEINNTDGQITTPKFIKHEMNEQSDAHVWKGYCGDSLCVSKIISPDNKWRIASPDLGQTNVDEGVYYFPANRPDLGVNVFLPQAEEERDDWGYERNYTWGGGDDFYFDNQGGLACIWKASLKNKTTQRILPVEGMIEPYYISYNGESYIIAKYIDNSGNREHEIKYGFYIAKE